MKKIVIIATAIISLALCSCDKVSPTGVLLGNTAVNDRIKTSTQYLYQAGQSKYHYRLVVPDNADGSYSFLVGSDSHMTTDMGRMKEMFDIAWSNNDTFLCHCGDIADTKAEYYLLLKELLDYEEDVFYKRHGLIYNPEDEHYYAYDEEAKAWKMITNDDLTTYSLPFFVTPGNHDITHDGWKLFSDQFNSSFFQVIVPISENVVDRLIFLDSANGTLGDYQIDLIDENYFFQATGITTRNTFTFTHTNILRPVNWEFSSTFPREETYYLMNKFVEWDVKYAFFGHVHKFDHDVIGGVEYLTCDAMAESNNPNPGEYLIRVKVDAKGNCSGEKVNMTYVPQKKK